MKTYTTAFIGFVALVGYQTAVCADEPKAAPTNLTASGSDTLAGLYEHLAHQNHWLTVKLIGQKTNRPAIGARIKIVTAGGESRTLHRHISSGSSFGGNPMQQTIGLGKADRIALLEIDWPTSKTTQVFQNVATDQAIEITEFAEEYRKLDWEKVPVPK